jgi:hypothetical protein
MIHARSSNCLGFIIILSLWSFVDADHFDITLRVANLVPPTARISPRALATFYSEYNPEKANQAGEILQKVGNTYTLLAGEMFHYGDAPGDWAPMQFLH